jgi:hypothetical protein
MGITEIFETWKGDRNIKLYYSDYDLNFSDHELKEEIPEFFSKKMYEVYEEIDSYPDDAFVLLLQVVAFANDLAQLKPDILGRLGGLISEVKVALKRIAKEKHANSYDVSASFPLGISVGLSWDSKEERGDK